ncbi:MAG: hypothetical protein H6621_03600 [Halobacteriovoraceae bacterium]|nr:hypothetical protein [Halobacteriovoraceae bacterium]MCB9094133.1 hypothetical protein [Halobacteriovoraceae bacterium]
MKVKYLQLMALVGLLILVFFLKFRILDYESIPFFKAFMQQKSEHQK